MKKIMTIFITLTLIFAMSMTTYAAPPIKVFVGGEKLETDVDPIIVNGRTMLPVRAVFESIGADVDYVGREKKVVAVKDDTIVTFLIDSNIMTINGVKKEIDAPATIKDGRTLVPLRACAEAFNLNVTWNPDTRTAKVKIPVSVPIEDYNGSNDGWHTYYTYDSNGNLTSSGGTKYTYDENGNLLYSEDSDGEAKQYTYDKYGNMTSVHSYNIYGGNDYNGDSEFAYYHTYEYDSNGNCILFKMSDTRWTKMTYDEHNNLVYSEENYGAWKKISYTYDYNGNILYMEWSEYPGYSETLRKGWSKYQYDNKGRKVSEEHSNRQASKWIYDDAGNLVFYEYPSENGESLCWERYEYDTNGNLIYHKSSGGTVEKYTYNDDGDLVHFEKSSDYLSQKYDYDDKGNVIIYEWERNEFGREYFKEISKHTYDENGNLIYTETEHIPTKDAFFEYYFWYTYDENGNKVHLQTSRKYTKYQVVIK